MIQVAQGHNSFAPAAVQVSRPHAAHAHGRNPQRVAGRLAALAAQHLGADDEGSCSAQDGRPGRQKIAPRYGLGAGMNGFRFCFH
jgi:hypothetical protein